MLCDFVPVRANGVLNFHGVWFGCSRVSRSLLYVSISLFLGRCKCTSYKQQLVHENRQARRVTHSGSSTSCVMCGTQHSTSMSYRVISGSVRLVCCALVLFNPDGPTNGGQARQRRVSLFDPPPRPPPKPSSAPISLAPRSLM